MLDFVVTYWFWLVPALIWRRSRILWTIRTQVAAARAAEDARRAAEAKAAEDARRAAEAKAAEDARRAGEAKAAEDARRVAEAKAIEDARRAAEVKAAEDARCAGSKTAAALVRALRDVRETCHFRRLPTPEPPLRRDRSGVRPAVGWSGLPATAREFRRPSYIGLSVRKQTPRLN